MLFSKLAVLLLVALLHLSRQIAWERALKMAESAQQRQESTKRQVKLINNTLYGSGTRHEKVLGAFVQSQPGASVDHSASAASTTPSPVIPATPANSPVFCRKGPGRRPVSHGDPSCRTRRPSSAEHSPSRGSFLDQDCSRQLRNGNRDNLDWTRMADQFAQSFDYSVPDTCRFAGKQFRCSIPVQGHAVSILRLLKIYSLPINIRLVDRGPYGVHFDLVFSHETVLSLIELFDSEEEHVIVNNIKEYENSIGEVFRTELKDLPPPTPPRAK